MITVKVTFDNGNVITTGINGTLESAKQYYLGKQFNLGSGEDDLMAKAVKVEEISGVKNSLPDINDPKLVAQYPDLKQRQAIINGAQGAGPRLSPRMNTTDPIAARKAIKEFVEDGTVDEVIIRTIERVYGMPAADIKKVIIEVKSRTNAGEHQFTKGQKVKDNYGKEHVVRQQDGTTVWVEDDLQNTFHSTKLWPIDKSRTNDSGLRDNMIIVNVKHPDWGTFRVLRKYDAGVWEIRGGSGEHILDEAEFNKEWKEASVKNAASRYKAVADDNNKSAWGVLDTESGELVIKQMFSQDHAQELAAKMNLKEVQNAANSPHITFKTKEDADKAMMLLKTVDSRDGLTFYFASSDAAIDAAQYISTKGITPLSMINSSRPILKEQFRANGVGMFRENATLKSWSITQLDEALAELKSDKSAGNISTEDFKQRSGEIIDEINRRTKDAGMQKKNSRDLGKELYGPRKVELLHKK